MRNDVEPDFLNQLDIIFAQLNPRTVEEFYAAYHQWSLHRRITELRLRIEAVREQQAQNQQRLQETRPTTIALAALARLQSNGVSDIALLDAMLERGESWLDQTIQRLDYFEQFDDFISDDYTKWCQGALEGAFDWIDSLRESSAAHAQSEPPPLEELPSNEDNEDAGDVEALLLERLATEIEQDDLSWQEAITLKKTAIKVPPSEIAPTEAEELEPPEIAPTEAEELEPPTPEDVAHQAAEPQAHITEEIPQDEPAPGDATSIASDVASSTSPEEQIIPEEVLSVEDTPISDPEQPALVESAPIEEPSLTESEHYTGDEQSAPGEFAAPSEMPPAEEISDPLTEQATEITMPEDIPTPADADTTHSEVNEPDDMENGASEDPRQDQLIPTSKPITPARSTPRKRGLIGTLIWIVTGK